MWRCHVITEGCRECEPGASRTLFSANTGIYLMKPVLKSCNAKEPASEVHLIGRVRVRQMHPVHLISVSLMGGSARTESPEGPALIYLCLKSQARTSQALYTSVTFHLAQHCGKKKKTAAMPKQPDRRHSSSHSVVLITTRPHDKKSYMPLSELQSPL